jgi:hypothetical protein
VRVVKDYCDHCGAELDEMTDYGDTEIEIAHHWFKSDLCKNCMEELSAIAFKFCKKEKER